MKDTLYRPEFFSLYDLSAIRRHLEQMAARGWLPEKPGPFLWKFRRVPPRKLHVAITCFPDASGFDPGPTEGLMTMAEYCARDGWTLLCQWGQLQIFTSDRENPTPIETDPVIQVDVIRRSMKRTMLPAYLLLLGLSLFQLLGTLLPRLLRDPVDCLSDPFFLTMVPFWLLLLASQGYELGYYFRWLHRAREAAEDGVFLAARPCRQVSWVLLGATVLLLALGTLGSALRLWSTLLWCGAYALIMLLVGLARDAMKRRGIPRWINRGISVGLCVVLTFGLLGGIVFALIQSGVGRRQGEPYRYGGLTFTAYHDDLPLEVGDLLPADGIRYSTWAETQETFLLSRGRYRQQALLGEAPDAPELEYTVVKVKAPFLYRLCLDAMRTEDPAFETEACPVDPAPWGAREAWRYYRHGEPTDWYLLAWADRLAKVRPRFMELTPERMTALSAGLQSF